jgi:beta-N-acetylhexosaminidase
MPNLFMIDLLGTEVSEEEKKILQHPNVGAVLLFSRNFTHPEQLKHLIEMVHIIRPDVFIAIDHEGGVVQRLQRHGFRCLPAARVYGDVFDIHPETGVALAKQYGERMAKDLLDDGIDLSLAPILDLDGINCIIGGLDRAFHRDPKIVALLAEAFIQGMNKAGMPATGKHFPGHGSVSSDSHIAKPILDTSMERLQETDLKPFIELINKNLLAAVMPAHVTYTAIDPAHPAGFSKIWLQKVLRDTLNFHGFILSDCLGMTGADIGDMNRRVTQALEAGCDMLIVCNQSRAVLYDVLQQVTDVPTQESDARLKAFKSQMSRFSSDKKTKTVQSQSSTITEGRQTRLVEDNQMQTKFNTTTSI